MTFTSLHLLESITVLHFPNNFVFLITQRFAVGVMGCAEGDKAGRLCPGARTQAWAIRGFTSSPPGQHLNSLAYRQAGMGGASPTASLGRLSPRKFSSF